MKILNSVFLLVISLSLFSCLKNEKLTLVSEDNSVPESESNSVPERSSNNISCDYGTKVLSGENKEKFTIYCVNGVVTDFCANKYDLNKNGCCETKDELNKVCDSLGGLASFY